MRKGMWSAAAVTVLVSAAIVVGGPQADAANTPVRMEEGSTSDPSTWKFAPEQITVPVGSTVTWTNAGSLEHDARTDNQEFSPLLSKGESHTFTFSTPGRYEYYCEPHRALGMTGVITVTGAASTPTTAATTPGTAPPAGGGTTTTTAKGAPASTTTTTRPGAGASGGSTTTTTAGSGVTSTTQASATTPTSGPESGGVTTTTTPGTDTHADEEALETHSGAGGSDSNPAGIALVGILTAVLAAISLKLLTAKP